MKCSQTEIFTMRHFEKTISHKDAAQLAKHLMHCENCREFYVAFEDAHEVQKLYAAPADFTESVMGKVRKVAPPSVAASALDAWQILSRVVWGVGTVILGIVMLFALNPGLLDALTSAYPAIYAATTAIASVGAFVNQAVDLLVQADVSFASDNLGFIALFFVAVMGTLLYVLHRGESGVGI